MENLSVADSESLSYRMSRFDWLKGASLLVLGAYWFLLMRHLHVEWSVNPQYAYGWAVPFLSGYLFLKRWPGTPRAVASAGRRWLLLLAGCLALAVLPTRLMEDANPEWRLVSWLLALEVVGLSLCALWLARGWPSVRHFWFPFAFFFVAVPWLRPLEMPAIGVLSRANAGLAVEVLNALGVPAIEHGNVIEVATGVVGIDEACSGIRSFQASLMIALFLGELLRLGLGSRVFLCGAGFLLAFGLNICRTVLLAWVASTRGMAAISRWHDSAGITILLGCFCALWGAGCLLAGRRRRTAEIAVGQTREADKGAPRLSARELGERNVGGVGQAARGPTSGDLPGAVPNRRAVIGLVSGLAVWLLVVEGATLWWYRSHERPLQTLDWSIAWPTDNPAFKELAVPEKVLAYLRFDEGARGTWQEIDRTIWQAFYFRWLPGRVWVQLVSDHNPSICLPGAGKKILSVAEADPILVHGVRLRFLRYHFIEDGGSAYVFYSVWEDGVKDQKLPAKSVTARDRFAAVLQGRRNPGQRVLEIAVWGISDPQEAQAALERQLERLIRLPK